MSLLQRARQALRRRERTMAAPVTSINPEGSLARIAARRWTELPETTRHRMVHALKARLTASERQELAAFVRSQGEEWMVQDVVSPAERLAIRAEYGLYVPTPFHMSTGMGLRNLLRENGVLDRDVPTGNLDDYYAQAVEAMAWQEPWPKVVWIQSDRGPFDADLLQLVRHADIVIGLDGRLLKHASGDPRGKASPAERAKAVVIW